MRGTAARSSHVHMPMQGDRRTISFTKLNDKPFVPLAEGLVGDSTFLIKH
jgi:hypothetical protein